MEVIIKRESKTKALQQDTLQEEEGTYDHSEMAVRRIVKRKACCGFAVEMFEKKWAPKDPIAHDMF